MANNFRKHYFPENKTPLQEKITEHRIYLRVTPNARQTRIFGWVKNPIGQKLLKISVAAIAEKGKANQAVLKFLSVQLKIPLKNITLEQGTKDQYKTILIKSDQTNVIQLLAPAGTEDSE